MFAVYQTDEISVIIDDQSTNTHNAYGNILISPEELIFQDGVNEFTLPNPFSESILKIKTIILSSLNIEYDKNSTHGDFKNLIINSEKITSIDNASYSCSKNLKINDMADNFLNNCINNGKFTSTEITTNTSIDSVINKTLNLKKTSNIENFNLSITKGNFILTCKYSLKMRITGQIEYKDNTMTITIKEAKAGFFNIKNKLLEEIGQQSYDGVIVKDDQIIIDLTVE